VLDEGHLTDNYGRVIDFKNTVVIMTSNVGARDLTKGQTLGFAGGDPSQNWERRAEKVREELKAVFNPEFLNRLDDTIVFHPLTRDHIAQIFHNNPDIQFRGRRLYARDGLVVNEWTATATRDGKTLEWDGIDVFPIEDGKIKRKDVYSGFGVAREIG